MTFIAKAERASTETLRSDNVRSAHKSNEGAELWRVYPPQRKLSLGSFVLSLTPMHSLHALVLQTKAIEKHAKYSARVRQRPRWRKRSKGGSVMQTPRKARSARVQCL
mmetsp:Transcript_4906/g.14869  ORF Transcript_4906/g.14869 Transcript_4906/m.14869 type:complete len:108 (+) Transcript_4906:602-925(+)